MTELGTSRITDDLSKADAELASGQTVSLEEARVAEPHFEPWPKVPRLHREVTITEKIDGTNAAVIVMADGRVFAQSRKRLIYSGKSTDNYGFAAWVDEHVDELRELGMGHHFGEWYGRGVQHGYGMEDRRFALFNTYRWGDERPACCEIVPVLAAGHTLEAWPPESGLAYLVDEAVEDLRVHGSRAPGAGEKSPAEGVIVYHHAANQMFKVTLENDEKPKGAVNG